MHGNSRQVLYKTYYFLVSSKQFCSDVVSSLAVSVCSAEKELNTSPKSIDYIIIFNFTFIYWKKCIMLNFTAPFLVV